MPDQKKIGSALISVYHKEGLDKVIRMLDSLGVTIYATGGTQDFIQSMNINVIPVEELTDFPSILGGRVKTLHPKVFGGILSRSDNSDDLLQMEHHKIPAIDLVIVDLYPFTKTVEAGEADSEIIEKIDIGGISLIRAAAKNFHDVVIIPSVKDYAILLQTLETSGGYTTLAFRKQQAAKAFSVSSAYDTEIRNWISDDSEPVFRNNISEHKKLRYGENPHQEGIFFGDLNEIFDQLSGKELSYNNLLDIDAAVSLAADFNTPLTAILKHNNACGLATGGTPLENWKHALQADPVSAFGGIIITTSEVDETIANEVGKLFFEVLIAPSYSENALNILTEKKNRIILKLKITPAPKYQFRTILNGVLWQDRDSNTEKAENLTTVTNIVPTTAQIEDLIIANTVAKHSRSNTIVLVKNRRLVAAGCGQTSRVDALEQAIEKARKFGLDIIGSVMASDAFFPFPDCVAIAGKAGIVSVIQPGGSKKDQESVAYCNEHGISMVLTGIRHFRH